MKILKSSSILILFLLITISIVNAQSECDKLTESDFTKLETLIAENAAQEDIDKNVERLRRKIKRCELMTRSKDPQLTEKLNKLIAGSSGEASKEQDQSIDFSVKSQYFTKMQEAIDRYRCMKEENKVLTREEVEVLENYKDDGSSYYKTNIMRGQNYLQSLKKRIDRAEFLETVKKHVDNKAKSINEDIKQEYKACFLSTLKHIESVALPGNTNLKSAIDYVDSNL